ncbi:gamma-glutamyltransferase [Shewanella baltica OS223]|uniref:gamma-glutamyltransferase n=1 Tax=Shewanella baltica TaxID=62322 RepID=UPI000153135B|nr:gamma-glutamyltransferase [Shewanella baltica]ACK48110.1 gamma-glutamyltransferase [Shewanella baltica OS223]
MIKTIKSICTLVTVATAISSSGVMAMDRITGKAFATRSEVYATHGMAATSQPLATQVAIDILKQGGSAVDAAIAANAMLGLVEPTGSGVGGDLFAIVWSAKDQRLYGLNASGRSPKSLSLEKLKSLGLDYLPPLGPLPVSVPGAVDGWYELHNKFGKLAMADNLAPAIHYARDGFPVSELIAYYLEGSGKKLAKFPGFKETYMPNGKMPAVGEIFKNPALANTYEKIAKGGRDAFYKGDIAKSIDKYMKSQGGYLSYDDLASHTSDWIEPVSVNYRGYDVWELPPNGQGIAALQILKTMEPFNVAAMGFNSPEYVHLFVEAKKLAFADRAKFYADMAFNKVPVNELISQQYNYDRAKLIDPNKAAKSVDAGNPALQHGDTVYLTTADKDGNMVSLIQSNYRGMGSGMTPPDLGFVLQDRGQMFDLTEGRFNTYAPGKRPFHTIIPAFVTKDGKPWLSFGVMGGATQPQMHAQIVMNLIDFKMNLQEAGDAPRILHMGSTEPTGEVMSDGGYVSLESGFPVETRRELIKKGHVLRDGLGDFGGYQAIGFNAETGVYRAASESRKDGHAAGY